MEIHPSYVYEQILDEAVSRLTPMVSTSRYPGFNNFSRAEAEQAINDLALVKAWAMNLIQ